MTPVKSRHVTSRFSITNIRKAARSQVAKVLETLPENSDGEAPFLENWHAALLDGVARGPQIAAFNAQASRRNARVHSFQRRDAHVPILSFAIDGRPFFFVRESAPPLPVGP